MADAGVRGIGPVQAVLDVLGKGFREMPGCEGLGAGSHPRTGGGRLGAGGGAADIQKEQDMCGGSGEGWVVWEVELVGQKSTTESLSAFPVPPALLWLPFQPPVTHGFVLPPAPSGGPPQSLVFAWALLLLCPFSPLSFSPWCQNTVSCFFLTGTFSATIREASLASPDIWNKLRTWLATWQAWFPSYSVDRAKFLSLQTQAEHVTPCPNFPQLPHSST